jgi:hypothetical protein
VKDLEVYLDSKFYFHNINCISSRRIKLLDLVHSATFNPEAPECRFTLYFTLVTAKVEYASMVCNSIMSTDAEKVERPSGSCSMYQRLSYVPGPSARCASAGNGV